MERITDHADRAVARAPAFLRVRASIVSVLRAASASVQEVEDLLFDVLVSCLIDTATGKRLDVFGRIVGQARGAMDDDTFRIWIRARQRVNRSAGTIPELVGVVRMVVPAEAVIVVTTQYPAAMTIRVGGVVLPDPEAVADLVNAAHAGGVRVVFEYSLSVPSGTFRLDVGPGLDSGHLAGAYH